MNSSGTDDESASEEEYSSLNRSLEVTRSPSQDDLLPDLECPVCFDLPLPPIRTCVRGHILCVDCCCKLEKCPLCQQRIDVGRNFFAENFLNKSYIKCRFRADGCTKEIKGELMKDHMQNCEFRPLKCKICSTKILFADFDKHMLTDHRIGRWDIAEDGIKIVSSYKRRHRPNNRNSPTPQLSNIDGVHVPLLVIISCLSLMTIMMVLLDYYYTSSDLEEELNSMSDEEDRADLFHLFLDYLNEMNENKVEESGESKTFWSVLYKFQRNKLSSKINA